MEMRLLPPFRRIVVAIKSAFNCAETAAEARLAPSVGEPKRANAARVSFNEISRVGEISRSGRLKACTEKEREKQREKERQRGIRWSLKVPSLPSACRRAGTRAQTAYRNTTSAKYQQATMRRAFLVIHERIRYSSGDNARLRQRVPLRHSTGKFHRKGLTASETERK